MVRRFPPPWSVEESDACYVVRDLSGQKLAYGYFEDEPDRRSAAYAALCRNAFSRASNSEHCVRSISASWHSRNASISAIAPCRVVGTVASRSHNASRQAPAISLCCRSHSSCLVQYSGPGWRCPEAMKASQAARHFSALARTGSLMASALWFELFPTTWEDKALEPPA